MGKEERKEMVLRLLADSGIVLTPGVMFTNLKRRGATFERRTLTNYLDELEEEGRVRRLDMKNAYYEITDKGLESL